MSATYRYTYVLPFRLRSHSTPKFAFRFGQQIAELWPPIVCDASKALPTAPRGGESMCQMMGGQNDHTYR